MKELTAEELMQIVATGNDFNLTSLAEECVKEISNKVDSNNASEILEFATKYDLNDLRSECEKHI